MLIFLAKLFVALTASFYSTTGMAAACCGSNSAVPAIISGNDQTQVSSSYSYATVVADAPVSGASVSRPSDDSEPRQTLLLEGATLLSDRWQAGLSLPLSRRFRSRNQGTASDFGLGDVGVNVAYEFLPSWTYSSWRPTGFLFSGVKLPTGGSLYESTQLYSVDSHGRGFTTFNLGVLLTRAFGNFDFSLVTEVHRSLGRTIERQGLAFELSPGWGASGTFSIGFSPSQSPLRFGVALSPSIEEAVVTSGAINSTGSGESAWTTLLQASYLINPEWSTTLAFSDQTWLGGSNVGLRQSVSFLVQKRWPR